jgi:hypothetical protein
MQHNIQKIVNEDLALVLFIQCMHAMFVAPTLTPLIVVGAQPMFIMHIRIYNVNVCRI